MPTCDTYSRGVQTPSKHEEGVRVDLEGLSPSIPAPASHAVPDLCTQVISIKRVHSNDASDRRMNKALLCLTCNVQAFLLDPGGCGHSGPHARAGVAVVAGCDTTHRRSYKLKTSRANTSNAQEANANNSLI